jgi:hypothetical protein
MTTRTFAPPTLRRISVNQIRRWGPCSAQAGQPYSRANLRKLFGSEYITPLRLARLPIPVEDRIWVLLHTEVLGERALHELTCKFAQHVLRVFEKEHPNDWHPGRAIAFKRFWINNRATDEELADARDEVMHAGWASRTIESARAAFAAGFAASGDANSANTVAYNAAMAAQDSKGECEWQLERVRDVLRAIRRR